MIVREVDEVGRGVDGLQAHVGPRHRDGRPIGHQHHQRHGHLERLGGVAAVLVGLDVELRGTPLALAQVLDAGQQPLLKTAQRPDDGPLAGLLAADRDLDFRPVSREGQRHAVALELHGVRRLDLLQSGNLSTDVDQWADRGDDLAAADDPCRRAVGGHFQRPAVQRPGDPVGRHVRVKHKHGTADRRQLAVGGLQLDRSRLERHVGADRTTQLNGCPGGERVAAAQSGEFDRLGAVVLDGEADLAAGVVDLLDRQRMEPAALDANPVDLALARELPGSIRSSVSFPGAATWRVYSCHWPSVFMAKWDGAGLGDARRLVGAPVHGPVGGREAFGADGHGQFPAGQIDRPVEIRVVAERLDDERARRGRQRAVVLSLPAVGVAVEVPLAERLGGDDGAWHRVERHVVRPAAGGQRKGQGVQSVHRDVSGRAVGGRRPGAGWGLVHFSAERRVRGKNVDRNTWTCPPPRRESAPILDRPATACKPPGGRGERGLALRLGGGWRRIRIVVSFAVSRTTPPTQSASVP